MIVSLALLPTPTLAFDPTDVIIYGIGTVIVVGSWIVNAIRKTNENRERSQQGRKYGKLNDSPADDERVDLDEIAARRREQLREMARQRGGQDMAHRGGGQGEPSNMTMAERIARARAKEQYKQRSETMRDAPRPQSEAPEHAAEDLQRQREHERAERERRAAEEQRRAAQAAEQQRREQAAERQRAEALAERRRQQQQQQAAQAQAQARARAQAKRRSRRTRPAQAEDPQRRVTQAERAIQKNLPKAAELEEISANQIVDGIDITSGNLTAHQLRQAFVMKEVLDKPVALRKTTELEMPW